MGFGEAIRTCFRKYFTISGRAPRSEFWWFYLFTIIGALVAGVIDGLVFGTSFEDTGVIGGIFGLVTLIPTITATIRRLHDTNRPGYYFFAPVLFIAVGAALMVAVPGNGVVVALAVIVMIFGVLLQLYWLIQKSDPHDNRYGPNPFMGERLDEVFE